MRKCRLQEGRSSHGDRSLLHASSTSKEGFTLLEIMITVAILATLALGATLLLVPVSRQVQINREVQSAEAEITRHLEHIQALPFDDLLEAYPQYSVIELDSLENGRIKVNYVDPETDPLEIQLVLSWSSSDLEDIQRIFTTARTK